MCFFPVAEDIKAWIGPNTILYFKNIFLKIESKENETSILHGFVKIRAINITM